MAEKNPNKLYDKIKSLTASLEAIKESVTDITANAKELINDSNEYGGEIARVVKDQMSRFFIPEVQKIATPIDPLVNGSRVAGSLKDLTAFLDSVPLAMVRQEPTLAELAAPVVPENVALANPVDSVPQNASFNKPEGEEAAPVQESKMRESIKKYQVVRISNKECALGDLCCLEDQVVAEFNDKESADMKCEDLKKTLLPEEVEAFGSDFEVREVELDPYKVEDEKK